MAGTSNLQLSTFPRALGWWRCPEHGLWPNNERAEMQSPKAVHNWNGDVGSRRQAITCIISHFRSPVHTPVAGSVQPLQWQLYHSRSSHRHLAGCWWKKRDLHLYTFIKTIKIKETLVVFGHRLGKYYFLPTLIIPNYRLWNLPWNENQCFLLFVADLAMAQNRRGVTGSFLARITGMKPTFFSKNCAILQREVQEGSHPIQVMFEYV